MTLGQPRLDVESCESTQLLVDTSLPEGALVVADHQTAGRGRLGRSWEAPAGTALLFSLLLKPPPERHAPELSLVAGVAVADALERTLGLSVQIKWPNDVMLRRKKVAGCLAEARDGAVVLGIGVNVEPDGGRAAPKRRIHPHADRASRDREELLSTLLDDLGHRYAAWRRRARRRLRGARPARLPPRPAGHGERHERGRDDDRPRRPARDRGRARRGRHRRERGGRLCPLSASGRIPTSRRIRAFPGRRRPSRCRPTTTSPRSRAFRTRSSPTPTTRATRLRRPVGRAALARAYPLFTSALMTM